MMTIKRFFISLALCAIPFCVGAQASPKVAIKSELASPVVLEHTKDKNYLKISLTGYPMDIQKRSPINLALAIDRSTSMSGERIERARDAAIMAVNMLEDTDTLSIVAYDSNVEVVVPATKVKDKRLLEETIRRKIQPRGMTALFAGLSKGIDQVARHLDREQVNRVILLSDGQANVGPTSVNELAGLARIAAKKGVAITTLGIGKDYNEDLMTAIAGYSDGNHVFVEKTSDLEQTFAREFHDVMTVVAQDVDVTIKVAGQVTPVRLLGREGEIKGDTVTVRLNQLYSNQEKYVLLEVVPPAGQRSESKPLAEVNVSYSNLATKRKDTYRETLALRYSGSKDEVKQSIVEDVLVDSAIQKTVLENERAIQLMDEGKMGEAKAVLDESARQLEALPVATPSARAKVQGSVQMNKGMSAKVMSDEKSVSRKALKEQTYNVQQNKKAAD